MTIAYDARAAIKLRTFRYNPLGTAYRGPPDVESAAEVCQPAACLLDHRMPPASSSSKSSNVTTSRSRPKADAGEYGQLLNNGYSLSAVECHLGGKVSVFECRYPHIQQPQS